MQKDRFHIYLAVVIMLFAQLMLVSTAFAYQPSVADKPLATDGCCGGCPTAPTENTEPFNGCCPAEGCCSACNAPLASAVLLPTANHVTGRLIFFEPQLHFPEVYLPIFVPPESRT